MKNCATCEKPLSARNRSGYCTAHVSAAYAADPAWRARQRAGVMRSIHEHPERLKALRARALEYTLRPDTKEARSRRAKAIGLAEIGRAFLTPESRAKAAIHQSETKMAWCPRELRKEYRRLVYSSKIPAPEARVMILEQHRRDMDTFRRKLLAEAA